MDRAGLLASRVRIDCIRIRSRPSRIISSGRGQFPRLQLRGSAGLAPASLSSLSSENARSNLVSKTPNYRLTNVLAGLEEVKQRHNTSQAIIFSSD